MNKNTLYGIFDDEATLLSSVKEIRSNNIEIEEVFSPFPIHGLDKALGFKETRMAIMAFIYGCLGLSLGALMIYFVMIADWPQNIGGKPNWTFYHNMPAFVRKGQVGDWLNYFSPDQARRLADKFDERTLGPDLKTLWPEALGAARA